MWPKKSMRLEGWIQLVDYQSACDGRVENMPEFIKDQTPRLQWFPGWNAALEADLCTKDEYDFCIFGGLILDYRSHKCQDCREQQFISIIIENCLIVTRCCFKSVAYFQHLDWPPFIFCINLVIWALHWEWRWILICQSVHFGLHLFHFNFDCECFKCVLLGFNWFWLCSFSFTVFFCISAYNLIGHEMWGGIIGM